MPKVTMHLQLTLPIEEVSVNEMIQQLQDALAEMAGRLLTGWLQAWQEAELAKMMQPATESAWRCPRCGQAAGCLRRGWRSRVLRQTSLGRIAFQLRQVSCRECGKTSAPFQERLGLAPYQVSSLEYRERAVRAVCQVSYQRGAEWMSQTPLAATVSPTGIHNWVQAAGSQATFAADEAAERELLLDGTEVHAGAPPKGAQVRLAMAIKAREQRLGRPHLEKAIVGFGVAQPWSDILTAVTEATPSRIVYDGESGLAELLATSWPDTPRQRCLWHLVNRLYPTLWKDELGQKLVRPFQEQMRHLLYQLSDEQARLVYQAMQDEMALYGLNHGARYLEIAAGNVFTYREHPTGHWSTRTWVKESAALVATSPLEREMREINRRVDNGSRWSTAGVGNLVALDLIRRHDRSQWRQLWRTDKESTYACRTVDIQLDVALICHNVKTT